MSMASAPFCLRSHKSRRFCGETKIHNTIEHFECQSSISCSYNDAGKSRHQEISGTSCHSGSCIQEDLYKANDVASCNAETTCPDIDHKTSDTAQLQQNPTQQKGNTLQDICMQDHYDDEDDDDDSDWEPVNHFMITKWFCKNCTMPNFDDVCHCDVCGEHKEFEISGYDSFLTIAGQAPQVSIGSDGVQNSHENCTAIAFDERMLLHKEVEVKPHPHPERPDRLRAIASSLVSTGIFPGKCCLIPAREITQDELQLIHSSDHIAAVQQTSQLISSVFGLFNVPAKLYAWILLILFQLLASNVSLLGHLCGILSGFAYTYGVFNYLLPGSSFYTAIESSSALSACIRRPGFILCTGGATYGNLPTYSNSSAPSSGLIPGNLWRNLPTWMPRREMTEGAAQDPRFPGMGRTLGSARDQSANAADSNLNLQARLLDDSLPDNPPAQSRGTPISDARHLSSGTGGVGELAAHNQHDTDSFGEELKKLVAMGFEKTQAEVALAAADGDPNVAIEILMTHQK